MMYKTKLRAGWVSKWGEKKDKLAMKISMCSSTIISWEIWEICCKNGITNPGYLLEGQWKLCWHWWQRWSQPWGDTWQGLNEESPSTERQRWDTELYNYWHAEIKGESAVWFFFFFTTELRSFSGRGSLISTGGSSGVRFSNSGNILDRTNDLKWVEGKKPQQKWENIAKIWGKHHYP